MPHYLVSWGSPHERLYDVTIRFTAPADTPRLLLPAWRPGRYLRQNYAANVREWSAGEHRVWKDGLTSWRVEARAGEEVELRYRYYAGVLDAGSSFLDHDEAYFNGSNLFMMVEGLRAEEHLLTIAAPAEWFIETQLSSSGSSEFLGVPRGESRPPEELRGSEEPRSSSFRARDYDHLIDSPVIAAAALTRHSFVESGARIHLVFRGDEGIDTEPYIDPLRAIVRSQAELFGGLPFLEYRFLYHIRDRWHGVEHENSCSIILRRQSLLGAGPGSEGWDTMLAISSHELFHAWNVKRIIPAAFAPYDYWQETPTRLLWVMEGLTSYYGELTLVRSGLWTVERYLEHLRGVILLLEGQPARQHLSLTQASLDGWLSDPAHMHDQGNAWYSFYDKGELVSVMLDLTIRRATKGDRSLDDVLRILWRDYAHAPMPEDAMERAVAEVADAGDFFARYVDGVEPLPYEELFAAAGVAFASAPRPATTAVLGARLRSEADGLVVENVLRGGAGMEAGLLPNDELLALGETRTNSEAALTAALRGMRIGETAELLIARAGMVRRLTLTARPDVRAEVTLRVGEPSGLRRAWLRRDE